MVRAGLTFHPQGTSIPKAKEGWRRTWPAGGIAVSCRMMTTIQTSKGQSDCFAVRNLEVGIK